MPTKERLNELFIYQADGSLIRRIDKHTTKAGDIAGHKMQHGYVACRVDGKRQMVHRLIWIMHYGSIPEHREIDHINQVKDDNRIENLRCVSHRINMRNVAKFAQRGKPCSGVSYRDDKSYWDARIRVGKREVSLGAFDTQRDALIARFTAEKLLGYIQRYSLNDILSMD